MSSVNSALSDGQAELFVSLVKQRDVSGVRALLESMDVETRSTLYQATCKKFEMVFAPLPNHVCVRRSCLPKFHVCRRLL